jgi:hypothetical protein
MPTLQFRGEDQVTDGKQEEEASRVRLQPTCKVLRDVPALFASPPPFQLRFI